MKIIYGVTGTGKSEYVFNEIQKSSADKIYIITPEQFSFTAERRLIDTLPEKATLKVEVLSFERMAYRVIKETIGDDIKNISKSGKAMLIYEAISKHQKELKFLGNSNENVDMIISQITEFKKHNINTEMLEKQKDETSDPYLKAKMNDMLIVYKELEDKITEDNYIDENDLLTILAENVAKSHLFDESVMYIDEFAGFTKQEYSVISELNKIAKEIYITVCTDELRVTKSPEADIFYDNKQTVQTLCNICDIDKDSQIRLQDIHRYKNDELKHLAQNLYAVPYKVYHGDVNHIKLYLAENQYSEVEHVAANIVKLVRDKGYRYSDIAVICRNIDTYASLCKAIFAEYEIPVFIDTKKDITQNLLIKYVISILDILAKNWTYESIFNYVKTGFVQINDEYEFENYCLKWGIQGRKWYEKDWDFERIFGANNFNKQRHIIVDPLIELKNKLSSGRNAEQISKELYGFLENQVGNKIDESDEMVQAWNIIVDVISEIGQLFGDKKMSFDEYSKVLRIGLTAKELGQIPQTQDKVIVGDVNRSKTHRVKAVFVIGVNDGVFPTVMSSEGFFNDKDRASLKDDGFELAKGTKEKMYEENFNIYKIFAAAEDDIYISYASSDSDGKALRRSLIISKIRRIFPELKEASGENDEVLLPIITFSKLLNHIDDPNWNEVYEWYKEHELQKLNAAIAGLHYSNVPDNLEKGEVNKLYGDGLRTSVSKLETYESCHFSYYLKYGLKLSDKDKLTIKPVDTGSFMHNVIDEFFKKVNNVKEISEEEMKKVLDDIIDENLYANGKFGLTAKYRTLAKRLKKVIYMSMKYIVQSLKNSDFDVLGTEISFGSKKNEEADRQISLLDGSFDKDGNNPPITLTLDDGRKVLIEGKIDRVDIAKLNNGKYIRIIDYKSSTKDLDMNKVIAGLQLQLITYVDAICDKDNFIPAGALYFNLIEPKIVSSKRNLSKEEIENIIKQNYRMNGIILADVNVVKAMDNGLENGKSDIIPVSLNNSGEINYSKSNTVTRNEFENLQKYANKIIKQISREILDGKIDLKPYYNLKDKKTPCSYCDYKSICQFNPKFKGNKYNYIGNKPKQEALDEIVKRVEK